MSIYLRVLLVVSSILANIYAVRKIRHSQMKIDNAVFWFGLSFMILLLSFFPQIAIKLTQVIGIQSPVNFVYLVMIFVLFYKVFNLAMRNAQLEHKTNILAEEIAILKNSIDEKKSEKICEENEFNKE